MDFFTISLVVMGAIAVTIGIVTWGINRSQRKKDQWKQLEGRTHRYGAPLTAEEEERHRTRQQEVDYFLKRARVHGVSVDRRKVDKLLNPNVEDVLDANREMFDGFDPSDGLYSPSVQVAETRADAAARQAREQEMFGGGRPRSTPVVRGRAETVLPPYSPHDAVLVQNLNQQLYEDPNQMRLPHVPVEDKPGVLSRIAEAAGDVLGSAGDAIRDFGSSDSGGGGGGGEGGCGGGGGGD